MPESETVHWLIVVAALAGGAVVAGLWAYVMAKRAERRAVVSAAQEELRRARESVEARFGALDERERQLAQRAGALDERERTLATRERNARAELERMAGLSAQEAKRELLRGLEEEARSDAAALQRELRMQAERSAAREAKKIVALAIQRMAAEHTAESTVAAVALPSEEMKGRIIGREGRNIRAFEAATGVDVIIDDTPGVVVVSCFDPVRREIARISLEKLVQDGRIHPARIEEVVAATSKEMDEELLKLGKEAVQEANIPNVAKPIIPMLGRLAYRTSYGQNVLKHSLEVAYISQVMADELGLDGNIARRAGLLHDIGKAMDHETEGGHPQIGKDFLKKFNEPEAVLNACEGHHGDVPSTTPYTPIVMAADAISASRPGARRESLERYIKRLQELEGIALGFEGVRQAYAIQAGREVRVIVDANRMDDAISAKAARDIAKKIEESMSYPGEIKVTLIREVRSVEYAR